MGPTLQPPCNCPSTAFGSGVPPPTTTRMEAPNSPNSTANGQPSTATRYTRARAGSAENTHPSRRSHKRVSHLLPWRACDCASWAWSKSAVAVRMIRPITPGQWSIFAAAGRDTRCISLTAHAASNMPCTSKGSLSKALDDSCPAALLLCCSSLARHPVHPQIQMQ